MATLKTSPKLDSIATTFDYEEVCRVNLISMMARTHATGEEISSRSTAGCRLQKIVAMRP